MKKTLKFITLSVIMVLLVVTMTGCTSTDNETKTTSTNIGSNNKESEENLKENIKIESLGIAKNGDLVFKVINNNSNPVYINTVDIVFKDNAGNFVQKASSEIQYFTVEGNSEVVNFAYGYEKEFDKYSNYEFEFELSSSYMQKTHITSNFEIIANDTNKQIAVSVKNNNEKDIKTMAVLVAFYKNEKIVGCQYEFNDTTIGANKTGYMNVRYPEDSNCEEISFDRYKAYLLEASID